MRAYAIGSVTAVIVVAFAIAEDLTERFVSEHSRMAGTAIELAIVALAALAFSPLHKRAESLIEAAMTKRRREAREALLRLQRELTSFPDVHHVLRRVIEGVDRHMNAAGSAIYLRRDGYVAEASSFDGPATAVETSDPLVVRLRSVAAPADPRALNSGAPGDSAFAMMAGGNLIGFLTLARGRIEYDEDDLHALGTLVEATGVALLALDPQLRPQERPKNNLPHAVTSFVGRETETTEIEAALREHRLVTLLGAGGIGKTRSAVHVASKLVDAYPDGAWLVELAPIFDATLVADTVAQSLGIPLTAERLPLDAVVGYLKRKHLLLVLDNCEHVVDGVRAFVTTVLQACPGVRILAASREGLRVSGEDAYRMPSLPLATAVALFADRARSADKRFVLSDENTPFVEELCRRLDGIPLAVELAAARTNVLSPAALVERLDERFRLLSGGDRTALPRQQTMRALIDWSYDLLSEDERKLFRTLSVFAASFTLANASVVCRSDVTDELAALDLLSSLVDKSLVQTEPSSRGTRYRLLESIRQYARDRLTERGEHERAARAHANAYAAFGERFDEDYEATPDREWLEALRDEIDNWRAALNWTLAASNDAALGQRLAGLLRWFWSEFAPAEGLRWLRTASEAGLEPSPLVAGKLSLAEAQLEGAVALNKASYDAAQRAREQFSALGETLLLADAMRLCGRALVLLGDLSRGEETLEDALACARQSGARKLQAWILQGLAFTHEFRGDVSGARALFNEALALCISSGADLLAANLRGGLAEAEFRFGDATAALRLLEETLANVQSVYSQRGIAITTAAMAAFLVALDDFDAARARGLEALALTRDLQLEVDLAYTIQHLAAVAALHPIAAEDDSESRARAARLMGYVDARLGELDAEREYTEGQEYERVNAALRSELGDEARLRLMQEGAVWSVDRAAAEATLP